MPEGSECFPTCNDDLQRVGGFKCSGGSLKGISYCIESSVEVKETDMVQASVKFTVKAGEANVTNTIKAALAKALGINVTQIVNVQVSFLEGRRLGLSGRSLAESTSVRVDFIVAVPEDESVGNVLTKTTELYDGESDSSKSFVTAMGEGGVEATKPEVVVAAIVYKQTMVVDLSKNPVKEVDVYTQTTTVPYEETDAAMRSPALIAHAFVLQFLAWVMRRIL